MSDKPWQIICADAGEAAEQFADESIDLIVTSPPYWGLRDYGVEGQLGLEPHPQEYLEKLWAIFDAWKPKLKATSCVFVNMGDTFGGSWGNYMPGASGEGGQRDKSTERWEREAYADTSFRPPSAATKYDNWLKPKNLLLIPSRFAIGMQERGWWVRNDIVWHKPNAMPSSVKSRFSCTWEHVHFFQKEQDCWFDLDAVRDITGREADADTYQPQGEWREDLDRAHKGHTKAGPSLTHPLGKNPGDCFRLSKEEVEAAQQALRNYGLRYGYFELGIGEQMPEPDDDHWILPTFAFSESHFAVYPPDLIRKPIRAACPPKVCIQCGSPWQRIVEVERELEPGRNTLGLGPKTQGGQFQGGDMSGTGLHHIRHSKTVGWEPTCECGGLQTCPDCKGLGTVYISKSLRQQDEPENAEMYDKCLRCQGTGRIGKEGSTKPGIVLDPFAGAHTTGLVCIEEDRRYIGVDISEEYNEMGRQRLEKAWRQKQYRLEI